MPTDRFDGAVTGGARARIRAELGVDDDTPVLVNVSRLVDGKGQEHLVQALARLGDAHPTAVLVLVGDGDRRPVIERAIAEEGLGDRVRLLGNRFDIADLLVASDVFVFGSETEGFGMVALEAMAAAKPVVAFRLPALQEFVEHGCTGFLVDLFDVDALAASIDELLTDPDRALAMGAAGRRVVDDRFPPTNTTASYEHAYRAVLRSTTPRSTKGS
jgi:glycosyltransferase involved in cell wall biosynthesis